MCFVICTVLLPPFPLYIIARSHDVGRAGMLPILQMRKLQSREVKWGPERPSHISKSLQWPGRYRKCVNKLAIIKHRVMGPEAKLGSRWPSWKHHIISNLWKTMLPSSTSLWGRFHSWEPIHSFLLSLKLGLVSWIDRECQFNWVYIETFSVP